MHKKIRQVIEIALFTGLLGLMIWLATKGWHTSYPQWEPNDQILSSDLSKTDVDIKTQLKTLLKCLDKPLITEIVQHGDYWLMKNLIRGSRSNDLECSESITFTTHGDYLFMPDLVTTVTRWMGPISVALFAPGYDFNDTMDSIQYARNCLPESQLIREYVSFHLYFPYEHVPYQQVPATEEEALKWPYDCGTMGAPYDNIDPSSLYMSRLNLSYPINVGRNIARKAVNTYFVFPCDIDIYPSLGLIDQFLQMAANKVKLWRENSKPRIFVLPIFELQSDADLPDTKQQLVAMLKTKKAVPFHETYCKYCYYVPGQNRWVKAQVSHKMEILTVAKRQGKAEYWEPFYISDNTEPDFDERVTWESQLNKRIQNYAMCLLDYEYHVLHPAFVVHSPGIDGFDTNSERMEYVDVMNRIIAEEIVPGYKTLYGRNKNCVV